MKLVVRAEASLDVVEAALSYEGEREGLGWDFDAEVDRLPDPLLQTDGASCRRLTPAR